MAKQQEKKVYDYNREEVRKTLLRGFRGSGRESTVADLAGTTGLPLQQIEAELPAVADEFGARLRVTDRGEILYSFPDGMKSRYHGLGPTLKKIGKVLASGLKSAAMAVFKGWIVLMLVGYFVLFIALALFAMVASIAIQQGGGGRDRNDRRGGGLGGLWLTTRLFDSIVRIWFYSELFKDPETRYRQAEARKARRPLHKAVFSHVFGDGDPNQSWNQVERKAVVAFLQTHGGIMTLPEFMAITGLDPVEAETAINAYLLEFEGSPEVTEGGSIYYSFPRLLVRLGTTPEIAGSTIALKRLWKFSSNAPKADRTFRLVNLVNLAFGGYFISNAITVGSAFYINTPRGLALRGGYSLVYSASGYLFNLLGVENPAPALLWGLGVVPIAFSALFFLIPILRDLGLRRKNDALRRENLSKIVYRAVLSSPESFRPESLAAPVEEARPADPRSGDKIAKRLAAWARAEPVDGGYRYDSIARTQAEVQGLRQTQDKKDRNPGETVFDTSR